MSIDVSHEVLDLNMQQCEDLAIGLSDSIENYCIATGHAFDRLAVVPRGSFGPANVVARRLGFKAIHIISASIGSYPEGATTAQEIECGQMPLSEDLKGLDILAIDEISDTDMTMQHFKKYAYTLGARSVKTAVLVHKPERNKSGETPDFYMYEHNGWVNFAWEQHDVVGKSSVVRRRTPAEIVAE